VSAPNDEGSSGFPAGGWDGYRGKGDMDSNPEAYDAHREGKYVCPQASRCTVCWPEAPQCAGCGRSVSCPGDYCSRCLEAVDALPEDDEYTL
jgi:hypothetical protein